MDERNHAAKDLPETNHMICFHQPEPLDEPSAPPNLHIKSQIIANALIINGGQLIVAVRHSVASCLLGSTQVGVGAD